MKIGDREDEGGSAIFLACFIECGLLIIVCVESGRRAAMAGIERGCAEAIVAWRINRQRCSSNSSASRRLLVHLIHDLFRRRKHGHGFVLGAELLK
jgi:hypothetical protein